MMPKIVLRIITAPSEEKSQLDAQGLCNVSMDSEVCSIIVKKYLANLFHLPSLTAASSRPVQILFEKVMTKI